MKSEGSQINIHKGAAVWCANREYVIVRLIDLSQVLARNLATHALETLAISNLHSPPKSKEQSSQEKDLDLVDVSADDWVEAKRRFELIKPLLAPRKHGDALAHKIAQAENVNVGALYTWRRLYLGSGLLSSLLPFRPEGGKGKSRIKDQRIEEALRRAIDECYLTAAKPSLKKTMEYLRDICLEEDLKVPDINTLRLRIKWRSARDVVAARLGERAASLMFDANEGSIPDAGWPLAMVQVDHTELPVMIVDDETRRSIGRPWVTFGIDIDSRMVPGMYLSLDHPSAMSAGMCISNAILPKDKWLADRGLGDVDWPSWGVMGSLHMDNAREFRGKMLQAACDDYTIDLHLRPVKKPHYGAHIERLMGTVSEELKDIPGTTFSGPKEKGEYDAEGNAIMTLAALERWLVLFLAEYHHRPHAGIGMPPISKYREGLLGTKNKPGRGLPARRLDEEKVRIDFMPYEERTIQDYGVLWDVHYFADVLRPWVNAADPEHPRVKRKFRFRRDPRDISVIYFFEPNLKRYYAIPYRDLSLPPVSLWEWREAKKAARKDGAVDVDEQTVFKYARRKREVVQQEKEKSKKARRAHQKLVENAKAKSRKKTELPKVSATPRPAAPPPAVPGYDPDKVIPFDEEE